MQLIQEITVTQWRYMIHKLDPSPCRKLHYLYLALFILIILIDAVVPALPQKAFPCLDRVAIAILAAVRGQLFGGGLNAVAWLRDFARAFSRNLGVYVKVSRTLDVYAECCTVNAR